MNIAAFITARLDEWERLASQALSVQTGSRDAGQPVEQVSWRRGGGHPQFALRHVATLRAIVESQAGPYLPGYVPPTPVLRLLAADWRTHQDYRPEWAPDADRA